jgi:hypothetical protein
MKKREMFFVFFMLILYISFISAEAEITGQSITGEAVTGKALQSSLALNITVSLPIPVISIISPKNATYLINESLLVNYSSVNADSLWYNLDLGSNITLNGPFYINVSQGPHTLYIYGNNTYQLTIENVSFVANSSLFVVLYGEYNGSTRGNSTDFINYTYEDLQSLNGIVLENTLYGKIRFNQAIDISNDRINSDNLLDLDSNSQISSNRIELNSTELPNFNTSATLWLYGLSFTNPRILRDGVVCPTTECIKESYSGGILRFYVNHLATYSAEETPYTPPTSDGGGGGGGGSSSSEIYYDSPVVEVVEDNITLISDEITVSLEPGESILQDFYLMNNYPGTIEAEISFIGLENFLEVGETQFVLPYQEIKVIKLNFSIPEGTIPDNYVGRILVKSNGKIYESLVSIDVQSGESLFDVHLDLDKDKLPANPGSYLWFKTLIYNVGGEDEVEVFLKYTLKDSSGKIIFEGEDVAIVGSYLEKEGKIKLPRNIPDGKYVLSTNVNYEGKSAVTSVSFEVQKKKLPTIFKILIPVFVIFFLIFILWFIGKRSEKKRKREQEMNHESLKY